MMRNSRGLYFSKLILIGLFASVNLRAELTEPQKVVQPKATLGQELAVTQPESPEAVTSNGPAVDIEQDTPVVLEDMAMSPNETGQRDWTPPKYQDQSGILGYSSDVFKVPAELKPQVDFWVKIYTQHTTDQGVLHDSRYINLIYEELDFRKIDSYASLSPRERQRAREKLVKNHKKDIIERLKRLQQLSSPDGLQGEDLRVWNMFKDIQESNKFAEAAQKGRLRFQLGQKDRFVQGIYYSGRYLTRMEQIFREAGLPAELTRLPFVESSFNLRARSKVGASGIWQFMRHTGRLYMKVNYLIDERNDPVLATYAAARLLKFNYNLLNNWPLAVTAYNFGPSGMKREMEKLKTDNLAEIIQRSTNRRLGFASGNFYASFLAAIEVERNANKYFGQVKWSKELQFDEIQLPKTVHFSVVLEHFDGNLDRATLYNPHLSISAKRDYIAIPSGAHLRLPVGTQAKFLTRLENYKERAVAKNGRAVNSTGIIQTKTSMTRYRVARGDTLFNIARQFGVKIDELKELNGIRNPKSIRVGQTLTIPTPQ